ncbi:hypothetical protein FACS1894164_11020 [Spirochaetia bacterium]|nr:hypothetical protein FACS1894164_11020 [Spirochaetia bacterium]
MRLQELAAGDAQRICADPALADTFSVMFPDEVQYQVHGFVSDAIIPENKAEGTLRHRSIEAVCAMSGLPAQPVRGCRVEAPGDTGTCVVAACDTDRTLRIYRMILTPVEDMGLEGH